MRLRCRVMIDRSATSPVSPVLRSPRLRRLPVIRTSLPILLSWLAMPWDIAQGARHGKTNRGTAPHRDARTRQVD